MSDETSAEVTTWARELVRTASEEHGRPLARYGTTRWTRMPAKQRWAAILIAAECWRSECDVADIAQRLQAEIAGARQETKHAEDADYLARAAAHREQWRYLRGRGRRVEQRDDIDEPPPFRVPGPLTVEELMNA